MARIAKRPIHYMGDVDIHHGGTFFFLDTWQWDYLDAVRVTPVSDAGGPDNQYWVETLTVNLPTGENSLETDALRLGMVVQSGILAIDYEEQSEDVRREWIATTCIDVGRYDVRQRYNVQIGPTDPFASERALDNGFNELDLDVIKLRANASLKNYALGIARTL